MARPTKKQQLTKSTHANRTSPAPLLPADVIHQIFSELSDALKGPEVRTSLLSYGRVARAWRTASWAFAYEAISLPDASRVSLFSRTLKQSPTLASCVRSLDLTIASVWTDLGSKGTASWKGHAVLHVLRSCDTLSTLSLSLGPTDGSSAAHLGHISNNLSIFVSFSTLASFTLESAIWLTDLALLLDGWPSLKELTLHSLRGDCSRMPPPPTTKSIQRLSIRTNTLSEQHACWLIAHQRLTHLSIALPGLPSTFFTALAHLSPTLTSLRLTNRFAAKGAPAPPTASPLLPFLVLSSVLEELQLSGDVLGPAEKLDELLAAVSKVGTVAKLWIDDGVREPLERALRKGELAQLAEVVSVGRKGPAVKSFEQAMDERGIELSRE